MYEEFYGLSGKPFSLLPDPKFLFLTKKHSIALSLLEYSLTEQAGITVLTGDIGCGKTTLVRSLLDKQSARQEIAYLGNTHESMGDMLRWILYAFGIEQKNKDNIEQFDALNAFLLRTHAAGKKAVLIVDEAQNLGAETLEQMRLLSNMNADNRQLLQLILVGQPELRNQLKSEGLEQFSQRVTVDYFIEPLSLSEIREYIKHRLGMVGGDPELFSREAVNVIIFHSRGIPRLINILCDNSLIYGFAGQAKKIDGDIVREVARDRLGGRILPIQQEDKGAAEIGS